VGSDIREGLPRRGCAAPIASWRELNVLFKNRAAISGFSLSGSDPDGWHWSSKGYDFYDGISLVRRFSDGLQGKPPWANIIV
jgi:hypothetical protein